MVVGTIVILLLLTVPKPKSVAPSSGTTPAVSEQKVVRDIKSAFRSANDKNIITWVNLAVEEKAAVKKLQFYQKAYSEIIKVYAKTPDQTKQKALEDLKQLMKL